jgi:hypothetical protein
VDSCEDAKRKEGRRQYCWSVVFACGKHAHLKSTTATHERGPRQYKKNDCINKRITKLEATIIKMKAI